MINNMEFSSEKWNRPIDIAGQDRERQVSELAHWQRQIQQGSISRREFMGRAAVLGITTAMATTMLARMGIAAEGKRGGLARIAVPDGATTDTLDPGTWPATFTQNAFSGSMCNKLTAIETDGSVVPDLAESMESSNGAKTWVFTLRKGLTFHDGKDVTPNDVVQTFRYHMGPNSKSAAKPLLQAVTDIKADGPRTIVFTLSSGSADFPYLVSDYHLPIMPAKDGGGIDWAKGVGTGPFTLQHFEPGVTAQMKRFANYHKTGLPYFDEVQFLNIADASARTNALLTGEIDYMSSVERKTLNLLKRNPAIEITQVTGLGYDSFDMNVQVAPFNNVDVRTALKYAVDRSDIVKRVYAGQAKEGNDNPIAAAMKYAMDPKPRHGYDPDKAKFLLKKAGLDSLRVDLSVSEGAFSGSVDAGLLYREHAAKAGIDINVVQEPSDGYYDKIWMKKPWVAVDWYGRATCDWEFSTSFAADAAWNDASWKNPRFNELLVTARSETDDAKRAAMYAEMQQLVHDDGGVVIVAFGNYVTAQSKKMAHNPISGIAPDDNFRVAERWWFT
jgi:peptide/nickel transport system substrate-binding protein